MSPVSVAIGEELEAASRGDDAHSGDEEAHQLDIELGRFDVSLHMALVQTGQLVHPLALVRQPSILVMLKLVERAESLRSEILSQP